MWLIWGKKILDIFRAVPSWVWLIIIIIILLLISCCQRGTIKNLKHKTKQMTVALTSALELVNNKNNEISYQKALLVGTESELEKLAKENSELGSDVQELLDALAAEKTKNANIKVVSLVKSQLINPELTIKNEIAKADKEGYSQLVFKYSDEYRDLEGMTNFKLSRPQLETKYHIIQQGDTYSKIAEIYGVNADQLRIRNYDNPEFTGINTLSSNLLPVGKNMVISYTFKNGNENLYHVVKSNETLYSIATRYGLTVDALKELNNLTDNIIGIDDTLVVSNLDIEPGETTLTKDINRIDLAVALVEEDGVQKIRVTPKNPNVVINKITGAIIENKSIFPKNDGGLFSSGKNRHSIGIQTGVGVGTYKSFTNNGVDVGWGFNVQLGYQYTLFSWRKK